jgi:glycosyltransferase involved in cell wall biosynthesis
MEQPLISVIIPTFNRAYCIRNAVDSIINQTYKNWELIIIDNSSGDATYKVLVPYLKNLRIKYFFQETPSSSLALNLGITQAHGYYIALLDDDDEFAANKLEFQSSEMVIYNADFSISNCIKVYDGRKRLPVCYQKSYLITMQDLLEGKFHLSHTHMMFKAEIKEECLFDSRLPASDDFDLLARIIPKYKVLFTGEPLSYINKSVSRYRISTDPRFKISTIENLITKIGTYCLTETEKQVITSQLIMRRVFWLMMSKRYKEGRACMRNAKLDLPFVKRAKYISLYFVSYFPFLFETTKFIMQHLWRISGGRIKG